MPTPASPAPVLRPESFVPGALLDDMARLSDPSREVRDEDILSLLAKYFFAYVHEGSEARDVGLDEIALLFAQYANRRKACPALEGREELRRRLLDHTFALTMLADLPRTAFIFGQIVRRRLDARAFGGRYLGLDIGAGTGVLMLADTIQARRGGFRDIRVVGLERDNRVRERTSSLCAALGTGRVVQADAKAPAAFAPFRGEAVAFVSNETIPGMNQRLWREDFVKINRTLFSVLDAELRNAGFFPEGLLAEDSSDGSLVLLCRANRFQDASQAGGADRLLTLYARGLQDGERVIPLHLLGSELLAHIPEAGRPLLGRRW